VVRGAGLSVQTVLRAAHKDSAVFSRLEIVETGRRRRWSEAEKLRIVDESEVGHRQVSATARRHGISRTLLLSWRRARDDGRLCVEGPVTFTPLVLAPDVAAPAAAAKPRQRGGRIEIALSNGRRLIVGPDVDAAAVARLADALDPR
jgi:transposase